MDCSKEQVMCAYRLHEGPVCAFSVHPGGFAVTGGADSRLRVWPLDFSDFLVGWLCI